MKTIYHVLLIGTLAVGGVTYVWLITNHLHRTLRRQGPRIHIPRLLLVTALMGTGILLPIVLFNAQRDGSGFIDAHNPPHPVWHRALGVYGISGLLTWSVASQGGRSRWSRWLCHAVSHMPAVATPSPSDAADHPWLDPAYADFRGEIRAGRSYRLLGFAMTGFFVLIGLASVLASYWNIDGSFGSSNEQATILFACFWGFWVLLGCYLMAWGQMGRLILCSDHIEDIGVFRSRMMALSGIHRVQWWKIRSGLVKLRGEDGSIGIDLSVFDESDRGKIIGFVRQRLSHLAQEGWDEFEKRLTSM